LKCVWLVLAFGIIKLLSVKSLNSNGYLVIFENNIATCFKDNTVLFIAYATPNSLFILDENSFAFYATDLED